MCCLSSAFVALLQAQTDARYGQSSHNNTQSQYNKASDNLQGGTAVVKDEVERRVNQFSDDHPASYTTMQREKARNSSTNPYYRDGQQYNNTANIDDRQSSPYKGLNTPSTSITQTTTRDTIPLREKNTDIQHTPTSWDKQLSKETNEVKSDIETAETEIESNGLIKNVSDEESADRPINRLFMTTAQHKEYQNRVDQERELKLAKLADKKDDIVEQRLDTLPRNTTNNTYYIPYQNPSYQSQPNYGYYQPYNNQVDNIPHKSNEVGQRTMQELYYGNVHPSQYQQQNPSQAQYMQPQYGYYTQPSQYTQDMQQRAWQEQQRLGYQQVQPVQGQLPQQQYGYSNDYSRQQLVPYQSYTNGQPSQQMGMQKSGSIAQNDIYGPYQQFQNQPYYPQQGYYSQQQIPSRLSQQDIFASCYNAQQQSYNTSMQPYSSMQYNSGMQHNMATPYYMHQSSYGYTAPGMMQQDFYQNSQLRERQDMYYPTSYTKSQGLSPSYQYGIQNSYAKPQFNSAEEEYYYKSMLQAKRLQELEEEEDLSSYYRPVYYQSSNLSKREQRRLNKQERELDRRFPTGVRSNREVGYLYANPDNAEKVFTMRDLEKRTENRSTMGKVQESKIAVDNYVFPSASIVLDGKSNKVQRKWRKFLKEESGVKIKRQRLKNTAYNKDKNARYFKATAVRLNEVTDKPGDVLTVFQKEKGHTRMDVAYKLGYQVALSPEESKKEFRNLESLVRRFNAENFSSNSKAYTKSLDKQIKATTKDLKREERKLSKMERTYNKRNRKGKADSYEALAVDLQRKTTESLKKDITTFEYMKMSQKNRANDIHLDRLHRN